MTGTGFAQVWGATRFRWLVAVRLVSAAAIGMVQAALATYVLFSPERAATPAKVVVAFALLLLPYSLIGPFAGVLLDRLWRRQVLLVVFTLQAVLAVVLALLAARGDDGPLLAVTVLVLLAGNRFVLAAISAGTPHVVPPDSLVAANAVAPTLGTAASVVGGLIGVALRAACGGGDHGSVVVLLAAAGGCLAAAAVASRLTVRELGPTEDEGAESLHAVVEGLLSGVRHLRARPVAARGILLVATQRSTFGMLTAVAVLQTRAWHPAHLEAAVRELTLAIAMAGAGSLVGALATPYATRRIDQVTWSVGAVAIGTAVAAVGVAAATLPGLLTAAAAVGAGGQAAKVCTDAAVQEEIDDDHRGRVFALYDMAVNVAIVAGVAYAVLAAPSGGGSVLVPVTMVAVTVLAGGAVARGARRGAAGTI